jgi:hypothetical protein
VAWSNQTDRYQQAPVIFVGIIAFALVYYFAGGHRTYDGPVRLVKDESNWNQRY